MSLLKILLKNNIFENETKLDSFMPYSFHYTQKRNFFISEEILPIPPYDEDEEEFYSALELIKNGNVINTLDMVKIIVVDKKRSEFITEETLDIFEEEKRKEIIYNTFNNLFITLRNYKNSINAVYNKTILPIILLELEHFLYKVLVYKIKNRIEIQSWDTFIIHGILKPGEFIGSILIKNVYVKEKYTDKLICKLPDILLEDYEYCERKNHDENNPYQLEKFLDLIPEEKIIEYVIKVIKTYLEKEKET